jgi:hypothetical protein
MKKLLNTIKTKFAALFNISLSDWLGRKFALIILKQILKDLEIQRERYIKHYESDPTRREPISAQQSYGAWEGMANAISIVKRKIINLSP